MSDVANSFDLPAAAEQLQVSSADGTLLNVEIYGPAGAATVVLVHGWICSTEFWVRQINVLLTDGLRVVAYDQRGHGASARPGPAGATPEALADDLSAVLAAVLEPGQRAIVAGHSMGAMALVAFGARHPDELRARVAAALLANTGMREVLLRSRIVPLPLPLAKLARPISSRLMNLSPGAGVNRLARVMVRYSSLSRSATEAEVDFCARIVSSVRPGVRADFGRMITGLDLDAQVAEFDVPTIVLAGTRDRLTPIWHARRLAGQLPQLVDVVTLQGVGHMAPVQAAEEVNATLRRLVREYLPTTTSTTTSTALTGPEQVRTSRRSGSIRVIDLTSRSGAGESADGSTMADRKSDASQETA